MQTPPVTWRKSSYSETDWTKQCVEVGTTTARAPVQLRDSIDPDGTTLTLPPEEYAALLRIVRAGALH